MKCPCCGGETENKSGIMVDLNSGTLAVAWSDTKIHLSPKEASLVKLMSERAPRFLKASYLVTTLWDESREYDLTNVRQYMARLRKKLAAVGLTVPLGDNGGLGYRIVRRDSGSSPSVSEVA